MKYTILFDEQLIVIESKSEIYFGIIQNKTQGLLLINIITDTVTSIIIDLTHHKKQSHQTTFAKLKVYSN